MKRMTLHIGMPKAASTTIQRCLENNRDELFQATDVFYPPTLGRAKHRDAFFQLSASRGETDVPTFYENHYWYFLHLKERALEENAFSTFMSEVNHDCKDKILCSLEDLWEPLPFNHIALTRIRDEFKEADIEIKIVAILRDQWSWLTSHFSTLIRSGRHPALPKGPTYTFDQFLWRCWVSRSVDYRRRLETFAEVFGRENVRVMWLEDVPKTRVVNAFFELCGIPLSDGYADNFTVSKPQNERPSWSVIRAMRLTNRLPIGRVPTSRALLKMDDETQRLFGRAYINWRPPFDERLADQIREMFAADNAILTREFGFQPEW